MTEKDRLYKGTVIAIGIGLLSVIAIKAHRIENSLHSLDTVVENKFRTEGLEDSIDKGFSKVYQGLTKCQGDLQTVNIGGNENPEVFYTINGNKAYVKIDGKPVDIYLDALHINSKQ